MPKKYTKGISLAFLATFISGVSIFVNKLAVDVINEPLVFTTVKNCGVALVVLLMLLVSGKIKNLKILKRKELVILALIGIIGGSIPFYLFFTGLSLIPAVNGAIIHKTLVLWVSLFAIFFLKERLSKSGWLAVIILFSANLLVGGFKGFIFSKGELYVLLATLFWSIETVLAKKVLPKVDSDILVEARMGIGAIVLLILSIILKPQALVGLANISFDKWVWIVITTVLLFAYVNSWYRSLKFAPATSVTAILVGSTLITNLLSAVFITHSLNTLVIIQSLLIAFGLYIFYRVEISKGGVNLVKI